MVLLKKIYAQAILFFFSFGSLIIYIPAKASGKHPYTMTVTISGTTTICSGSDISLTATVSGGIGTLSYQWKKNGSNITGITGPPPWELVYASVSTGDQFTCTVTSTGSGTANSNTLTATVTSPQTFTVSISPNNVTFCQGATVNFTSSGNFAIATYQWSMNGSNVSGATSSTFSTTASSATQLKSVSLAATSTASCISNNNASAGVSGLPFVVNPLDTPTVTISTGTTSPLCLGQNVSFTSSVTNGGSGPSYQWMINGTNVSGATSSTFSTTSLTNGAAVTVSMTSDQICATPATVTSNSISFTVNPNVTAPATPSGPSVLSQGSGGSYSTSGGNATSYNWSLSPSSAGTISSAGVLTLTPAFIGTVSVNAASVGCNGPSSPSSLSVTVYQALAGGLLMPVNLTISTGNSPGILTAAPATGGNCGGSYHYQWQNSTNGTSWSNISDTTLNYSPGNLTSTTYYRVRVICGTDTAYTNVSLITIGTVATDHNFIQERDIIKPGVTDTTTANGLTSLNDVHQTTQYYDGIGRPIQTVAMQASPLGDDMVTVQVYDPLGREAIKYLPYTSPSTTGTYKSDPVGELSTFNSGQFPGEDFYYAQTNFEPSPLNRKSEAFSPGQSWVGADRGVSTQYLVNATGDSVQNWYISPTAGSIPVDSGAYAAGLLTKNVTTDEQGHQVVTYTNILGHMVLRKVQVAATPGTAHVGWLCTYYVYDDVDNLRFVIQPQAVNLIDGSWLISSGIAGELCFRYEYDGRKRMVIKKLPGAGEAHMVYDARDRLVLTQDSILRSQQKWQFLRYDSLDRGDSTGLITDPSDYNNQSYHQNLASTSISYPNLSLYTTEVLSATYYDDYTWETGGADSLGTSLATNYTSNSNYFFTTYTSSPYAVAITAYPITRGMVTGTMAKVLASSSHYLYAISFYDDRGRAIQTRDINYSGGVDTVTTQFAFNGVPLRVLENHHKNGTSPNTPQNHIILTKMNYDPDLRLKSIYKNIDGATSDQLIDSIRYNELGQMHAKYLGSNIDSLIYDYNICGWVDGINKNYLAGTSTDYFGMELAYDKSSSVIGSTSYLNPVYNGNIAGTIWKSAGDGILRKYDFSYDNVNRLTAAAYKDNKNAGNWGTTAMDFSVGGLSYDANGNILSMNQHGFKLGSPGATIDSLIYTYSNSGVSNKLLQVIDNANDSSSVLGDFHYNPSTKSSTDYSYDGSGNLNLDNNKAIDHIHYNYLNLADTVHMNRKGNIYYTYDAAGNRLVKEVMDSTSKHYTITSYLSGFVYQQMDTFSNSTGGIDTLQFVAHEEGRARWAYHRYVDTAAAYGWEYDFFEKDHVGNTRVVLTQEKDTANYLASMEAKFRTTENALFYNIPETSYPRASASGYPVDLSVTNPNDSVCRVNGSGQKVGPAIILKVMSGDVVNIAVSYYYNSSGATNGQTLSVSDIINSLASGIVGVTGGTHGSFTQLTGGSSPLNGALSSYISAHSPNVASTPNAYLNYVLVDNQFNYDSTVSGARQVQASGTTGGGTLQTPLAVTALQMDKSGYLYIFVSNATPGWDVFFDDLSISTHSGPMLEENHYYPGGLAMQALTDKALKTPYAVNKYRYNGKELQNQEFSDGTGLEEYDFGARLQDPQLSVWHNLDPFADKNRRWSPYVYSMDNPLRYIDPDGMWTYDADGNASTTDSTDISDFLVDMTSLSQNDNVQTDTSSNGNSGGGGSNPKNDNKNGAKNNPANNGLNKENAQAFVNALVSGESISLIFEFGAKNSVSTEGTTYLIINGTVTTIANTFEQYTQMAEAFGAAGRLTTVFDIYQDYNEYKNGEISEARFDYRLTGAAASLLSKMITDAIIGAETGSEGGPWGTVTGIVVGAMVPVGEYLYDNWDLYDPTQYPQKFHDNVITPTVNIENALRGGWIPH